ncbi:MAG: twin-arginine translocation signal domain-containing protein [Deltaproteobacteria bacterium]|nr:twin-arginine translocation signal domain-containing protein [Deltaproteobacteria bacterium]
MQHLITRRRFLRGAGLALGAATLAPALLADAMAAVPSPRIRLREALRGLDTRVDAALLRRLAGAEAEALLTEIASDRSEDGRIRMRAVASLTALGSEEAVVRLRAIERSAGMAQRLRWHARHGAVAALGQRDPARALGLAAGWQADSDPLLREAPIRALRHLPADAALAEPVRGAFAALLARADRDADTRVRNAARAVRRARQSGRPK